MGLAEDSERISGSQLPEGYMAVRTTHGNPKIHIYGVNGMGISLPVDKVDDFIAELEKICIDSQTLYQFGEGDETFDFPGYKLQKASDYLKEARDIGVHFANYTKIF